MEEDYVMIPGSGTKKIIRDVKKEIETAFLDYSMSVIVSRALPDVRDGLKPVHRRILYTMHERGNDPSHPYRKSADTVGAVLGSYHPHGDASVYDAMVRLAQDFSLRYPLVDGQGNFGSVDGDPPAAYRYTEARMSRMAVEMLTDIEKDTIDWDPNFDETKKEPSVLPCRFPNLLVNGSQGIAVGMATNIPPHNLSEVIDGCIAYIDDPDIDLPGLMEYIKGPDFPTAGIIMGRSGIRAAYATGRGKITLRGRATIEETKNGRTQIIITEIPYMVNKARLIENMADLVKDKRIEGITHSMCIASVLLQKDPELVTGAGAGLDSAGLKRKTEVIRRGIGLHHPDPMDGMEVLQKVGGFDLAAMAGAFLGGAIYHVPVVIDGVIAAAAAAAAGRIAPAATDYMLAAHVSAEPASIWLLDLIGVTPAIQAGLRLGEGTGALALFPLLDMALSIYRDMDTFAEMEIEEYKPLV